MPGPDGLGIQAPADLAFVLPDLRLGGAQRVATSLLAGWLAQGRRVCVITLAHPSTDFFTLDPRVARISLDMQRPRRSLVAAFFGNLARIVHLRRAVRRIGAPRVLSFVAGINILTVLATRGLGLRVVVSERNDPARQDIGRPWRWLRRITYPMADLVTANSAGAVAALGAYVPADRLALVPNSVEPAAAPVDRPGRPPVFLAVGRLTRQKGYDVLLRAFADARRSRPGWQLVVAGDGEELHALTVLARNLGVSDAVDWRGAVADPTPLYREAAMFVQPSRFEGVPNALLEAMAQGLPVIVSDTVAPGDGLIENSRAVVTPVDDAPALARAMTTLAGDPDLRYSMGRASAAAVSHLSRETILKQWDAALRFDAAPPTAAAT